ncbi:MAG: hypothetical protein ACR2QR_14590 [Woeseiaceae bacterium]
MNTAIAGQAPGTAPGPSITEFEEHAFEVEAFDHEAHLFVAWQYLQQFELLESIDRFRQTLISLTRKLEIPGKYHETITWFYMIAVAEGATGDAQTDWGIFKQENPALFRRSPSVVRDYYSGARLMSEQARATFLLPDLAALG